jgi:hypothetical protein
MAASELSPDAFGYLSTHPHFPFLRGPEDRNRIER